MLHVTTVLEDTVIVASWSDEHQWLTTVADNITGKSFCKPATSEVFNALISLAVGMGETDNDFAHKYYPIVEAWLEGTPPECRPIP